jgi:hypothetical protein
MRRRVLSILVGIVGTLLVSTSALAHHGGASIYDMKKETSLKGTITEFVWTNPHVEIGIETAGSSGTIDRWLIELGSPANVVNRGWSKRSLKPGDVVTITIHPGLRGEKIGMLVRVVLPDGKELKA